MSTFHHAILYLVPDVSVTPFDLSVVAAESEIREITSLKLSIDEVRALIIAAYTRPFELSTQTIVLRVHDIGVEAQHALLKVLEEPPVSTRFILIVKRGCMLLPTVLSRVVCVDTEGDVLSDAGALSSVFTDFLDGDIATRLEKIATILKAKDQVTVVALDEGLTQYLQRTPALALETRKRLFWCQSNLRLHGASKKMLWEEIALSLKVEKGYRE